MIFSIIRNIFSVILINIIILINKILKKKIIFFYHPQEKLTLIHNYYIEDLFKEFNKEFCIIYGHRLKKKLGKKYFYLKQGYIKYLINVDYFISNNICDVLIKKAKKIYMHHNIYDDPWVPKNKEEQMCKRLSFYDYIFLSSDKSLQMTKKMFDEHKIINKPRLIEVGYPKIDFLYSMLSNESENKKNILIAPTQIDGFPEFSIVDSLNELFTILLSSTNYNIIFRPHPRDRNNEMVKKIIISFEKNKRFNYDISENYIETYSKSYLLITDISGTAYTYAFLTSRPVIFITPNENKLINYNYDKLNFFLDRNKIGKTIKSVTEVNENIKLIEKNYNLIIKSIELLRKDMKFFGKSKERFVQEVKSMNISFNNSRSKDD